MEAIDSSSVGALRAELARAWEELAGALGAASSWWDERRLEPEDGGADAWSPRLALWHAIAAERIRAAYLQHVVETRPDQPVDMMAFAAGDGSASLGSLRAEFRETVTPDQMMAALAESRSGSEGLLSQLSEDDLDRPARLTDFMHEYLRGHGQHPSDDVRGVLLHGAVHLRDHAQQVMSAADA